MIANTCRAMIARTFCELSRSWGQGFRIFMDRQDEGDGDGLGLRDCQNRDFWDFGILGISGLGGLRSREGNPVKLQGKNPASNI